MWSVECGSTEYRVQSEQQSPSRYTLVGLAAVTTLTYRALSIYCLRDQRAEGLLRGEKECERERERERIDGGNKI